jgi:hypothetical protein
MAAGVPNKIAMESAEANYSTPAGQRLLKRDLLRIYQLLSVNGIEPRYMNVSTLNSITQTQHGATYVPEHMIHTAVYNQGGRIHTTMYPSEKTAYTSNYIGA